ncbi:MAG: Na/Pi cotransporter family protein [Erysipelotrichaceae bacterium]|nr:Na/Pi cotransporter family protein [Erysipelotrichaceae bacterium]
MELLKSLILLLAGVGVFIVGMNMMSEGLEKGAGGGLKKLLAKISNNRFLGVGIGAGTTAIIQSSSATTVMVIGLVNAGVITLFQAISVIMGANIGTTVTGLIVALSGQKGAISFSDIAIIMAFVGVMMMFVKKDKVKLIGSIICGLGVIFVGLDIMSGALDASNNPEIISLFQNIFSAIDFPLLLILFGALFTALIQSSSAATGIIIVMAGGGIIPVETALFIVLGTNIGTCVTALLACLGTGTNAKRTAFIHFTFNLIGTIIFTAILWPTGPWFASLLSGFKTVEMQIAIFHVIFNVTTTLLLIPFVQLLEKLSMFVIKDHKKGEEELHLKFIDDRLLSTPAVALMQVKNEIEYMASLAHDNMNKAFDLLVTQDAKLHDEIYKRENLINFTNHQVTKFLIKLSPLVNEADEKVIGSYFHVVNDIERIGDHAKNFVDIGVEMKEQSLLYSDAAYEELKLMYSKLSQMFEIAMDAFDHKSSSHLNELTKLEEEVDEFKSHLSAQHFARLSMGDCKIELSAYFHSTVSGLERVGDHLVNIGYSILNPTGSQSLAKKKK